MAKANSKVTSPEVARVAAKVLQDPNASAMAKRMAGSALAQRQPSHQTGANLEDDAARVLASTKYSGETKTLAASVTSQSNKGRQA
jgi:hypothetical protein